MIDCPIPFVLGIFAFVVACTHAGYALGRHHGWQHGYEQAWSVFAEAESFLESVDRPRPPKEKKL